MVSNKKRRVEKLEGALTPKQAILMWLQDAHRFDTVNEYVDHQKDEPDSAWPLYQLLDQVANAVKQELKPESTEGRPWGQPLKKPAGAPLNLG